MRIWGILLNHPSSTHHDLLSPLRWVPPLQRRLNISHTTPAAEAASVIQTNHWLEETPWQLRINIIQSLGFTATTPLKCAPWCPPPDCRHHFPRAQWLVIRIFNPWKFELNIRGWCQQEPGAYTGLGLGADTNNSLNAQHKIMWSG